MGSVVFLLLLLVVVLLLRRRRARNRAALLRMQHQQYRTTPPNFTSLPRFSAASDGSNPWSVTPAQALPAHPTISHALSFRAATATAREDVVSKSPNYVSLPKYPGNSLAPRRFLSLSATSSNSKIASERQRDVERAIQQLQGKMMKVQAQNDRNTVEGIEDEVEIVRVKLEIERLKRVLDSEWALGMTDEIPAGLHCL